MKKNSPISFNSAILCNVQARLVVALLLISTSNLFSDACPLNYSCDKTARHCAKNTLYRDGFNIRFYSGPCPIVWKKRGCMSFLDSGASCSSSSCSNSSSSCSGACATPFFIDSSSSGCDCAATAISSIQIPKFNKLFRTPWTVGAMLGYAVNTHHEVVLEFNYTQASNKDAYFSANVKNSAGVPVLLHVNLKKYKNASAYFGYRFNFNRMRCFPRDFLGDMAWFLGIRAGLLHHFGVRGFVESSTSTTESSTTPCFDIFKSSTSFSGIGEVGVDICLNCDWSLMIGAEVAAAWGPSCHNVAIPVTELSSVSINTAKIGAEILFPVTFGLRYKF